MTAIPSSSFSSSSSSSCGACKFLRRKCSNQCVFAPYFSYDEASSHFAAVHKVFGASNVSKLLLHLPLNCRSDAAITIAYEALERIRDPIYGCFAHIFALQQEVASLQEEIEILGSQIANVTGGDGGCGSFPTTDKDPFFQGTEAQLHDSVMNTENYQNQMNCPQPFHQALDSQMDIQISPSFGFEHENLQLHNLACLPW